MLTDFETTMFFDTTLKPDVRFAKKGLKIHLSWDEYADKFDDLWQLSKPSVMEGALEKLFIQKPKARTAVDKDILSDLEDWRGHLAKNLYKENLKLFHSDNRDADARFLKEVTQKILDRIIFIRFCEDRGLVSIRPLKPRFDERGENTGTSTYTYILNGIFREYEGVFNSDLFKAQDWEKDLRLEFTAANKIVQETCEPYMFDVIPIEVLGNIYEQYLGYTIKLAGDSIKYELKPEVRKAGGVYYTPAYIVDYIVKNTVGKLLGELPEAKAKKLRILDPACGSGSFLIRAYDEMLKYYLELKKKQTAGKVAKREEKDKETGQVSIEAEGHEEKLTVAEKAMILKEHIYGVDIDDQAVEVTKLSLMLKMLNGEWGFVKGTAVLPMLDKNIKCGNSLISGDKFDFMRYFGENFNELKPFNWKEEFKEIMADEGGFDIVIGNPPYIQLQKMKDTPFHKAYKEQNYEVFDSNGDIYCLFYEKGIQVLKENGILSFITSNKWMRAAYGEALRGYFSKFNPLHLIDLGPGIFESATVDTNILIIQKKKNSNETMAIHMKNRINEVDFSGYIKKNSYNLGGLGKEAWFVGNVAEQKLNEKIEKSGKPLKEWKIEIYRGILTGFNEAFIINQEIYDKLIKEDKNSKKILKPILRGRDIEKYGYKWGNLYLIATFPFLQLNINDYPAVKNYLLSFGKEKLEQTGKTLKDGTKARKETTNKWFETQDTIAYYKDFLKEKVIWKRIGSILRFGYDTEEIYGMDSTCIMTGEHLKYLCAYMNSKLGQMLLFDSAPKTGTGDLIVSVQALEPLLVPPITAQNQNIVDKIEKTVDNIIVSKKVKPDASISELENEIDRGFYEMYELSDSEIEIVENKMKQNIR